MRVRWRKNTVVRYQVPCVSFGFILDSLVDTYTADYVYIQFSLAPGLQEHSCCVSRGVSLY